MVKLHFKLGNHKDMMERYRQMLTYVKSAVTRNYSEKARLETPLHCQQRRVPLAFASGTSG